jgi:hypothetical protein
MGTKLAHLILLSLLPVGLTAQSLEQRVTGAGSGTVHLSFAARPGVCGEGGPSFGQGRNNGGWEADCEAQPVRAALEVRNHRVTGVRAYVGGHWKARSAAVDLGTVGAREAAAYFLSLAEQSRIAGDPVLPAALADSATTWPALLRLARLPDVPLQNRRSAVFWLSQAAGAAAGRALDSIASAPEGEREIRKEAVFALSQRSADEAVPALIQIAKRNPDPEVRRTALFWLGQSEDPRALALFEEILR